MSPFAIAWRLRRDQSWLLTANFALWGTFHAVPAVLGYAV